MALALGLGTPELCGPACAFDDLDLQTSGSIFNHSTTPNVSYILDTEHACIRYITMRTIAPADELCIFYGSNLWFDDRSSTSAPVEEDSEDEDALARLARLELDQAPENHDELIPEAELPFKKVAVNGPGEDEEDSNSVRETSMLPVFYHFTHRC